MSTAASPKRAAAVAQKNTPERQPKRKLEENQTLDNSSLGNISKEIAAALGTVPPELPVQDVNAANEHKIQGGKKDSSASKTPKNSSTKKPKAKKAKKDGKKKAPAGDGDDGVTTAGKKEEAPVVDPFTKKVVFTNHCKLEGIPSWRQINHICASEQTAERFLIDEKIIVILQFCPKPHCGKKLPIPRGGKQRCRRCEPVHGKEFYKSIYNNTFFAAVRVKKSDSLVFLYHWLTGAKTRQLSIITGWSTQTMTTYHATMRELISIELVSYDDRITSHTNNDLNNTIGGTITTSAATTAVTIRTAKEKPMVSTSIGGKEIQVQMADMRFGNRIYRPLQEKFTDGSWLFCAIEVTPTHRYFCLVVPNRKPATLTALMKQYIAPGSIIRIDHAWTASDILDIQKGFDYLHQDLLLAAVQGGGGGEGGEITAAMMTMNDQQNWNSIWGDHQEGHAMPNLFHQNGHDIVNANNNTNINTNTNNINATNQPVTTTNTIVGETALTGTKRSAETPQRRYNNVPEIRGCLFEFIWRNKHKGNLWRGLLQVLTDVHYKS